MHIQVVKANRSRVVMEIRNFSGHVDLIFPHQEVINKEVGILIEYTRKPLIESVGRFKKLLEKAVDETSKRVLDSYPHLQQTILDIVYTDILECEKRTIDQLVGHIEAHKAYINTRHPDVNLSKPQM